MVRPARQDGRVAAILVKHRRSTPVKEQIVSYPRITRWSYGWAVPPIRLLAAVLAADGVSYVLVGSAGLHLRGHCRPVGDIDAVPAPDQANLETARCPNRPCRRQQMPASAPVNYFGSCPGADELWPGGLPAGPRPTPEAVTRLRSRRRAREAPRDRRHHLVVRLAVPAPVAKSLRSWTERHRREDLTASLTQLEQAIREDRRQDLRNV